MMGELLVHYAAAADALAGVPASAAWLILVCQMPNK